MVTSPLIRGGHDGGIENPPGDYLLRLRDDDVARHFLRSVVALPGAHVALGRLASGQGKNHRRGQMILRSSGLGPFRVFLICLGR